MKGEKIYLIVGIKQNGHKKKDFSSNLHESWNEVIEEFKKQKNVEVRCLE